MTEADDAKPKDGEVKADEGKQNTLPSYSRGDTAAVASEPKAERQEQRGQQTEAEHASIDKPQSETKRRSFLLLAFIGLFFLLVVATALALYQGWKTAQQVQQQVQHDQQSLAVHEQSLQNIKMQMQSLRVEREKEKQALNQQLNEIQRRLSTHNKRLLSLSTTSREDWLLAEAEYLLKLANQRLLIERDGSAADGLLSEADAILRDLDDPDLNPVRQALARDITALRLMQRVDIEGIYFALVALMDQLDKLPFTPTRQQLFEESKRNVTNEGAELESPSWWTRLQLSFSAFARRFGDYIRITRDEPAPNVLIAPMEQHLVEQNTRMMLLRAQIALLQRKTEIYQQSLKQALSWIADTYPRSVMATAMVNELNRLADIDIDYQVTDISGSLELLRSYVEDLHKLGERSSPSESDKQ